MGFVKFRFFKDLFSTFKRLNVCLNKIIPRGKKLWRIKIFCVFKKSDVFDQKLAFIKVGVESKSHRIPLYLVILVNNATLFA